MKLSIITINKNNSQGLERTIQSVINQTFRDFEYIIIDGASTDGSVEIIKKYQNKIDYWVSEPDRGIYHAMNKGIKVAKGEYLLFLNSGDWLTDDTILEKVFSIDFNEDIVYGNIMVDEKFIKKYPNKITLKYFLEDSLPHPATLIKKKLFNTIGRYNESLKIAADWEFFLRAIVLNSASIKKIELAITHFYTDGISSYNIDMVQKEKKQIISLLLKYIIPDYNYFFKLENEYKKLISSRLIKFCIKIRQLKIYNFLWKKFLS